MRRLILPFTLPFFLALPTRALADLVVVVNPRSGVERLTRDEVINIFLGRYRQFPGGLAAHPIDLPESLPCKGKFYLTLVGKSPADISAYWARLRFSGQTGAPRQAGSLEGLLELIAADPGAIGYLERARVDSRVRVVLELLP